MDKIAIVTDSAASIPEPMLADLNIHTVAYYIHRGSEVLRDLVTIQRDEFLRWMHTAARHSAERSISYRLWSQSTRISAVPLT